ncbi:MAG: hypothetical protein ACK46V_03825 [Phycisphaerae bacterium]|jgi:hypothetical protein
MFSKLTFLIISLGIVGCSLLALRQQRLQAASEMAQAQLRIRAADERLFELRSMVAARITPQQVEKLAMDAGGLRPATNDIPGELTSNELTGLDQQGNFAPPPEETKKPAATPTDGKPAKPASPSKPRKQNKPSSSPSRYATRPE